MREQIQIVLTSPLCYFIITNTTKFLYYHVSILTLQNSVISHPLWCHRCDNTEFRVYGARVRHKSLPLHMEIVRKKKTLCQPTKCITVIGRVLGITGGDPSVCKSDRLHVDILWIPLLNPVYSINSSKLISNFPAVLNFNWLLLKSEWFICN